MKDDDDTRRAGGGAVFGTTCWTVVLKAQQRGSREAEQALGELCRSYWQPLYAYVRRSGHRREEAEDLTQEFFARLVDKDVLSLADREKGKLRTFLLTVMKRLMISEWRKDHAERRGGGSELLPLAFEHGEDCLAHEPVGRETPEEFYDRNRAARLLERVMAGLEEEYSSRGMAERFDELKDTLWWNANEKSYGDLAGKLGMKENAVKQAVSRLRTQYRNRLREEITMTLDRDDSRAVDEEIGYLIGVLRRS